MEFGENERTQIFSDVALIFFMGIDVWSTLINYLMYYFIIFVAYITDKEFLNNQLLLFESFLSNFIGRLLYFLFFFSLFPRSIIITTIFYFTVIQFVEIILSHENLEDVTEILFMIFTYLTLCFKCLNFLLRKEKLLILLNLLRENICRPRNLTEAKILENYTRRGTEYIG